MDTTHLLTYIGIILTVGIGMLTWQPIESWKPRLVVVLLTAIALIIKWDADREAESLRQTINARETANRLLTGNVHEYTFQIEQQNRRIGEIKRKVREQDSLIFVFGTSREKIEDELLKCRPVLDSLSSVRERARLGLYRRRDDLLAEMMSNPLFDSAGIATTIKLVDEVICVHDSTSSLVDVLEDHIDNVLRGFRQTRELIIQQRATEALEGPDRQR